MDQALIDRIDQRLKALGFSERAASIAATGRPDAIRGIRRGQEPGVEKVRALARTLQVSMEWLLGGADSPTRDPDLIPNVCPAPNVPVPALEAVPRDIPIRGIAACSSGDGAFLIEPNAIVDWARRPPSLAGVREAYGLYLCGDSMEPRWSHGDLILVHPGRPARPGDHVVIILKDGPNDPSYAYCKRLVRRHNGVVTVEQYNPRGERDFPEEKVMALHRVMTPNELYI